MKIKIIRNFKFDKYIFFLSILAVGFLVSLVRYSLKTYDIPIWDEQHYMYMATQFYRLLKTPSLDTFDQMLQVLPFRQPGYPLLITPFLMIFGLSNSYFWALFTNGLLYVSSIFAIFFIARNYLTKLASFLASMIFAFYSWTLYFVHFAYSETATLALCAWTILFLIKSEFFKSRKYSILFGLFLALALLTRWVAIIFLIGPLFYILYQIFKKGLFKNKIVLLNITLSIFIALLLLFYPYYATYRQVFDYFGAHLIGGPNWQLTPADERSPFSLYSLTFYLGVFAKLGIFYFILIIVGFFLAFLKKSKLKLFVFAGFVPWLFFSFFSILKSDRFIIPIYPYLAILSASVFDYVRNKYYKVILIIIAVLLSFGTFLGTVWGKGPLTGISRPPNIYRLSGKEIVDFIAKDSKMSGMANPQITVLFSYRPLDEPIYTYNLYNQEKPLNILYLVGSEIKDPDKDTIFITHSAIGNADYILTKSDKKVEYYFTKNNYQALEAALLFVDNIFNITDFYEEKAKFWIYQDSSTVTVFKKKIKIEDKEMETMRLNFVKALKSKLDQ